MSALTTTTANEAITIKVVAKHDIQTLIGYTRPPVDGGEPSMDDLTSEHPLYRDIRSSYVYDYFKLPSIPGQGVVDFENELDPKIMGIYYAGMSEWFAKEYRIRPRDHIDRTDEYHRLGAKKVVIFDHIVRHEPYYPRDQYSMGIRGPAMRPHIDVTHKYAPEMFRDVQGRMGASDIEEVLQSKHWQSYNLWRPIKIVKRDALAMPDTRSASRNQLVSASFDQGDGHVVSMDWLQSGLQPEEPDNKLAHRWYYMHEQKPDEAVAFKIFDSDPEAKSNGTPHTDVHIPGTEDEETRLSIELRCFAIFE